MISRFYEQFSRNSSAMAPERMFEKISNFKIMNILYIILKHVVWRFRIYNYFREIFKFRENMSKNRFREISLSVHKIAKLYIRNLQTTYFKMIYNTFIFLKFEIFSKSCSEPLQSHFAKIAHKIAKSNIFQIFKMNPIRCEIPFPMIYSLLG